MGSDAAFRVFFAATAGRRHHHHRTRSFPLGLCVRHSICRPELSRTRGSADGRTRDGRPCLMVNPRDKEEPTTTISQPWGTNERAAWRGERGHETAVVPDTLAPASHTINGAFRSYEPRIYHVSLSPLYFLATFSSPSPAILLLFLPTSLLRFASARN